MSTNPLSLTVYIIASFKRGSTIGFGPSIYIFFKSGLGVQYHRIWKISKILGKGEVKGQQFTERTVYSYQQNINFHVDVKGLITLMLVYREDGRQNKSGKWANISRKCINIYGAFRLSES